MKEINLEEIIDSVANLNTDEDNNPIYYLWEVKKAMKEACNQCLTLSAENVITKPIKVPYKGVRAGGFYTVDEVDKNSILQIKNWIK